ncbi:MAG: ribonuclease III [Candidatus Synoicihabitans palmerolidicus]|nr:ribonuclease III [Candidatus Synoicihabitans palmerolidicus]
MSSSTDQLQDRINYRFNDPQLLRLALTHPSWLQQDADCTESNQRLEFLGDAVLQMVLTEALFQLYPDDREGALSQRRVAISNGHFLAQIAREIDLADHLLIAASEESMGGRHRPAALEDAFEALIGAIYSDSDFTSVRQVVLQLYGDLSSRLTQVIPTENPKGRLQERVHPQFGNNALRYEVSHISGEDHAREYEAQVFLKENYLGAGRGTSKKAAEAAAARTALASALVPPATDS